MDLLDEVAGDPPDRNTANGELQRAIVRGVVGLGRQFELGPGLQVGENSIDAPGAGLPRMSNA